MPLDYKTGHIRGFDKGLSCGWKLAKRLMLDEADGGLSDETVTNNFGSSRYNALRDLTAFKALATMLKIGQAQTTLIDTDSLVNESTIEQLQTRQNMQLLYLKIVNAERIEGLSYG